MSAMTSRRAKTEGRRGSRIDTDEGGRYVGIPLNGQCSVQETGCGTNAMMDSRAADFLGCARGPGRGEAKKTGAALRRK